MMKHYLLHFFAVALLTGLMGSISLAQGVARGPVTVARDPELEKQSHSSLNTAKFYFYKRKPAKNDKEALARSTKSVLDRLTEIVDTNPNFARMDSVIFLMGEVYQRDNQPEKANEQWALIVKEFPDSEHAPEAKKRLGVSVEATPKPKDTKAAKPAQP